MGFRFRRSVRLLPGIKLNLSRGGPSVSIGGKGFHYTVGSKGSRVTAGLPGTGLSWTHYTPNDHSSGHQEDKGAINSCVEPSYDPPAVEIKSAPAETLNALSISDLAPVLNRVQRRIKFTPLVSFCAIALLILSIGMGNQLLVTVTAVFGAVSALAAIIVDRYQRSVRITYELEGTAAKIAEALKETFADLESCRSVWNVSAQQRTSDWKRNAGATQLNKRESIRPAFARPRCLRGNVKFPVLKLSSQELYFLPDAVLVVTGASVAALAYQELNYSNRNIQFIEEESVPKDASIVGNTWRYVNKSGGPDRRFNSNRELPICAYGEMQFSSNSGMNGLIHYSKSSAGLRFSKLLEVLRRSPSGVELRPISSVQEPRKMPSIVFFACFILFGGGIAALALTSVRPEAHPRLQAGVSVVPAALDKIQNPQFQSSPPAPRNILPPPMQVDPKPKATTLDTLPRRREESSVGQQAPFYMPSTAQCLSIVDVDERVDCLEAAHATRKR